MVRNEFAGRVSDGASEANCSGLVSFVHIPAFFTIVVSAFRVACFLNFSVWVAMARHGCV